MTTQEIADLKRGLKQLAKRAERNIIAEVEAGRLDFDKINPRDALRDEMVRLAREEVKNGN